MTSSTNNVTKDSQPEVEPTRPLLHGTKNYRGGNHELTSNANREIEDSQPEVEPTYILQNVTKNYRGSSLS